MNLEYMRGVVGPNNCVQLRTWVCVCPPSTPHPRAGKRPTDFCARISEQKIFGKQQNLPKQQNLTSNEIPTEKSLGFLQHITWGIAYYLGDRQAALG